jgi:hypothetical protein
MDASDLFGFPPRRHYIVLPRRPVAAALNGLALYDSIDLHQRVAERAGRVAIRLGAGRLLRLRHQPPLPEPAWWDGWLAAVRDRLSGKVATAAFRLIASPFTAFGATAILLDAKGAPLAFAKFVPTENVNALGASVLRRLTDDPPTSFRVPAVLDVGTHDGFRYTLQETLPPGRHRRLGHDPAAIHNVLDELQAKTRDLLPEDAPAGWLVAHGSLGPRNLRIASDGAVWVFDWDSACAAPRLGDELRYWIGDLGHRARPSVGAKGARIARLLLARGDHREVAEALRWREARRRTEHTKGVQAVRSALARDLAAR